MNTAVVEALEKKPGDDSIVQIQCFMFPYICILSCMYILLYTVVGDG